MPRRSLSIAALLIALTAAVVVATPPDSIPIASFTFDDGFGGPDAMGWTTQDFSLQEGTYFHVEDFVGLTHPASPLAGAKSMWCGVRPDQACSYALPPGYGSSWDQSLESAAFPVTGDVTLSFIARFDTEVGYDVTYLDYYTKSDRWHTLRIYDTGPNYPDHLDTVVTETIPSDSLAGTVRIRFHVVTDGAWDDQVGFFDSDGAVFLDSLMVSDGGGMVDFQDFEAEAVDALATLDGDWSATVPGGVGDYAGLFVGSTILQEDTVVTNSSYLWGFFNGSTDAQGCLGHPGDPAVPVTQQGIENYAVSPPMDISALHIDGQLPSWMSLHMAFDIYKHTVLPTFPFTTYIRPRAIVRERLDGCWQSWSGFNFAGGTGEWVREAVSIDAFVDPAATDIQIGVGLLDLVGSPCHTGAPLFDNVTVYALAESTVTAVGDDAALPMAYTLLQNHPNPFNPSTTIRFQVPDPGARVSLRVYDVRGRHVRTLHDRWTIAGDHVVSWTGVNEQGGQVGSGVYFYRLEAPSFATTRKMVLLQ